MREEDDGKSTGCVSEWGFSLYVQSGHCGILYCPVVRFRNVYA